MKRKIFLTEKVSGNKEYCCDGSGCGGCEFRFHCFTMAKDITLWVDWEDLRKRYFGSPSMILQQATKSKIFVRGSRRYREAMEEIKEL